jgi:uncharacterized protein YjbJ (UPF0337 family)
MNWDQVEGKMKQWMGSAKQRWGKLTDDELQQLAGKRDEIVGKLQEKYGWTREEAEKDYDEWRASTETPRTRTSGGF